MGESECLCGERGEGGLLGEWGRAVPEGAGPRTGRHTAGSPGSPPIAQRMA